MTEQSGQTRAGQLFLLSAAHMVNDSYAGFLAPLLPLLVAKFGLSLAAAGFLSSILSVSASLAQPLYGYLADRVGHRYFVVLGPLMTAVFMSSLGVPNTYTLLVLIVFVGGVGTAFFHPQGAALAGAVGGSRKGFGMSIFSASGSAGYALGPLFAVAVVTAVGLDRLYIAVIPGLGLSILLWRYILRMDIRGNGNGVGLVRGRFAVSRPLVYLWCIVVLRAFVVTSFATFIPLFLEERGHTLVFEGTSIFLFLFCGACGGLLGGYLSDLVGRRRIILVSLLFAAPFLLLFLYAPPLWATIGLACGGAIFMSSVPVVLVMAQELMPDRVGTVSGLMMGLAWGVGGLGVSLVGILADAIGLTSTLAVVAAFPLVTCAFAFALPRR